MIRSSKRNRYFILTSAAAIATATSMPAWAQVASDDAAPSSTSAPKRSTDASGQAGDDIIVTGSRIRRADLGEAQPAMSLSGDELERRSFANAADALNELPIANIGNTPTGQQDSLSAGRNYINLFGLGGNRTLTLVNGRRFISSNVSAGSAPPQGGSTFPSAPASGEQVDLNSIPVSLIDRIEVVESGGAAVYGSDAIAGVVNIILKKNFQGVALDAQTGISSRGDAPSYNLRATVGANFADGRGNIIVNGEYSQTSALLYSDRAVTSQQLVFARNPANMTTTDGIPGAILVFNRRVPEVTPGGIPFLTDSFALNQIITIPNPSGVGRVPAQFAPDGTLVPYNPGTFYSPSVASGGDGYNLANSTALQSSVQRAVFTTLGRFEFNSHLRLIAEGSYITSKAVEPTNQPIFNSALVGDDSDSILISIDNPFLSAQARSLLQAQGINNFYLSRISEDIVGKDATLAKTDTYRGVIGLEGEFSAVNRNFNWNVSFNRGHVDGRASTPNVIQSRFEYALDPVRDAASGQIICRVKQQNPGSTDPAIAGCVPMNLFGNGAVSQAARDYLLHNYTVRYSTDQTDILANIGGDIVRLPGGVAKFNAGYEHREQSLSIMPDAESIAGLGRDSAVLPASGSYRTNELYAEAVVPLVGGDFTLPLIRSLEFDGAYRRVWHSAAGQNSAWSMGVKWVPVDGLTIRGTRSRSFRAPGLTELYSPQTTTGTLATDPCDASNISGGSSPTVRAANCAAAFKALGLPANYSLTSNVQTIALQVLAGGNPNLTNEVADSWSAGATFEPRFVPGLVIKGDFIDTKIKNAISSFTLTSILSTCYDSPTPVSACNAFTRSSTGQLASAQTGYINAGYTNFRGITAGFAYRLDSTKLTGGRDLGAMTISIDYFHLIKLETSISGTGFDLNNDKGELGNPVNSFKLRLTYEKGPFYADFSGNYIGPSKFDNSFTPETRNLLGVGSYFLSNLSLGVTVNDKLRLTATVNNLFDVDPPYGTMGERVYDLIGRYFNVGASVKF